MMKCKTGHIMSNVLVAFIKGMGKLVMMLYVNSNNILPLKVFLGSKYLPFQNV